MIKFDQNIEKIRNNGNYIENVKLLYLSNKLPVNSNTEIITELHTKKTHAEEIVERWV